MLTVVLPTYNRSSTIGRALRSVLSQTYESVEVIIVDDGSEDDTEALVRGFQDARVRYVRHETNQGVSAARNTGVRLAKAPWVVFLDSDDEMLPTLLEQVSEAIEQAPEEVGFMWCGRQRIREHDRWSEVIGSNVWHPVFRSREEAYKHFLKERYVGMCSGFGVRVKAFLSVGGFDEGLIHAEDVDLLLRLARRYDFIVLENVLINYYIHEGVRLSRASGARALGYRAVLEKNRADIMADREAAHDFYSRIWGCYYGSGHYSMAQLYGLKAVWKRPECWHSWIRLAKSLVAPVLKPGMRRAAKDRTCLR